MKISVGLFLAFVISSVVASPIKIQITTAWYHMTIINLLKKETNKQNSLNRM